MAGRQDTEAQAAARAERLKAALKANIARRKAQARARASDEEAPEVDAPRED